MSRQTDQTVPEAQWWEDVGFPLVTALKVIHAWANEGNPKRPRGIGFLELQARVDGHLHFNGRSYSVGPGFAELVASQAKTYKTPVYPDHEATNPKDDKTTLGSTRAFDLACQIAAQNERCRRPVPVCLQEFAPSSNNKPKRPKGRGEDGESRVLRDMLAWWGILHGVKLGLCAERNRDDKIKYDRLNGLPSASDLVTEAFHEGGWSEYNYSMAVNAWQAHRYGGDKDKRKLTKKSNEAAYHSVFREFDRLIRNLPPDEP